MKLQTASNNGTQNHKTCSFLARPTSHGAVRGYRFLSPGFLASRFTIDSSPSFTIIRLFVPVTKTWIINTFVSGIAFATCLGTIFGYLFVPPYTVTLSFGSVCDPVTISAPLFEKEIGVILTITIGLCHWRRRGVRWCRRDIVVSNESNHLIESTVECSRNKVPPNGARNDSWRRKLRDQTPRERWGDHTVLFTDPNEAGDITERALFTDPFQQAQVCFCQIPAKDHGLLKRSSRCICQVHRDKGRPLRVP